MHKPRLGFLLHHCDPAITDVHPLHRTRSRSLRVRRARGFTVHALGWSEAAKGLLRERRGCAFRIEVSRHAGSHTQRENPDQRCAHGRDFLGSSGIFHLWVRSSNDADQLHLIAADGGGLEPHVIPTPQPPERPQLLAAGPARQ